MRVRLIVCALAGCATLALCLAAAETAAASGWSIQQAPDPDGARYSVLSGVSCTSPAACIAVGYFTDRAGAGVTLAERWNGTRWAIQRTPNPAGATSSLLFGVSCASRTACTAVGSVTNRAGTTVPLAERWNGTRWAIQRTRRPPRVHAGALDYLGGVSCPSLTTCVAVGHSGNSLGTAGTTLVERWDRNGWAIQPTPVPAGTRVSFLSGVSCTSPASCTAAGFLIDRAGAGVTLAEHWNATSWTIQPTDIPTGATYVQILGLSCTPGSCTAVGFFDIVTGIEVMLAERRDAGAWVLQRTLYPAGARYVQLVGVSCAGPRSCTAVGFFNNATGFDVILAEHWDGTGWAIQPAPDPAGATNNSLGGVSCPTKRVCIAVGGFTSSAGTGMALAERFSSPTTRPAQRRANRSHARPRPANA
jgi:hypothetical protein